MLNYRSVTENRVRSQHIMRQGREPTTNNTSINGQVFLNFLSFKGSYSLYVENGSLLASRVWACKDLHTLHTDLISGEDSDSRSVLVLGHQWNSARAQVKGALDGAECFLICKEARSEL